MKAFVLVCACAFAVTVGHANAVCDPNIPGDIDENCMVDFNDFALLSANWPKISNTAAETTWVARYNGPDDSDDQARAIAVDSDNNIYVTGISWTVSTSYDYVTVKYSADSNLPLWVARYDGPGSGLDWPWAIAIDGNDNIYVIGHSAGIASSWDYATVKYSPDSNQPLWVARYNGPANASDEAYAVAVDSNNNIYVTGTSVASGTSYDYATIKYAADSNQPVWVARYNGPGNDYDHAHALAFDSSDNIYVTGHSAGITLSWDYATVKYSADSNQPVWVARYNGPDNDSDKAYAVAVDSNDNIYVTGHSTGLSSSWDYATIKYSADSNQPLWVARYNGPGNASDEAKALVIDSDNNIYVTGHSEGLSTSADYATVKYSADSNQPVWVARYNGTGNDLDWPRAMAIDSSDSIYVTGHSEGSGSSRDYTTVKYSADSNQPLWVARYNGSDNSDDRAEAIAVNGNNNVYVTGNRWTAATSYDFATIKVSNVCEPELSGDINNDCGIDFTDLYELCRHWLDCNLDPPGDCWQ